MGNFKMVCLDIDGTLLNSKHEITERTKNIIKIVSKEKNIPVILVSARMPKGILPFHKELGIVEPIICYSGALIIDEKRDTLLGREIQAQDIENIYNIAKECNVHISLYKNNEWFVEELDEWAKQESEITKIEPTVIKFQSLIKVWRKEKTGANKILFMSDEKNISKISNKLKEEKFKDLNIYPSKPTYLEIMPSKASKTSAIEFLCKKLNISKEEVIAIGDNYNDIDMLEYAGVGIAMGNAPNMVKEKSDEVTATNNEDGVAKALEKYFL
jgi:Cof subfamily protein (haloacid dehalogenase superfamily)